MTSRKENRMNLPVIEYEDNQVYMLQDISGVSEYERAKAIINFCDKESKLFEKAIDREIIKIFERNGIEIPNTDKSVLKLAFDLLKAKGKNIEVKDMLEDYKKCDLEFVKLTKGKFVVALEDKRYLQCCVMVKEIKL